MNNNELINLSEEEIRDSINQLTPAEWHKISCDNVHITPDFVSSDDISSVIYWDGIIINNNDHITVTKLENIITHNRQKINWQQNFEALLKFKQITQEKYDMLIRLKNKI